jgi:hypothetical protein
MIQPALSALNRCNTASKRNGAVGFAGILASARFWPATALLLESGSHIIAVENVEAGP